MKYISVFDLKIYKKNKIQFNWKNNQNQIIEFHRPFIWFSIQSIQIFWKKLYHRLKSIKNRNLKFFINFIGYSLLYFFAFESAKITKKNIFLWRKSLNSKYTVNLTWISYLFFVKINHYLSIYHLQYITENLTITICISLKLQ